MCKIYVYFCTECLKKWGNPTCHCKRSKQSLFPNVIASAAKNLLHDAKEILRPLRSWWWQVVSHREPKAWRSQSHGRDCFVTSFLAMTGVGKSLRTQWSNPWCHTYLSLGAQRRIYWCLYVIASQRRGDLNHMKEIASSLRSSQWRVWTMSLEGQASSPNLSKTAFPNQSLLYFYPFY